MNRSFIKKNKLLIVIILLVTIVMIIHKLKPSLIYRKNGSIRHFGLGYKNKTITPLWLTVIILSILLYVAVDYYILYPNINK